MAKPTEVNINTHGKRDDRRGEPASYNLRQTPKNWGSRKVVGVIRNGAYVDPDTGEPISLEGRTVPDRVYFSKLGGIE